MFNKTGLSVSSLQISYELLLRRIAEVESYAVLGTAYHGVSDRRKYPTATYDLNLGVTNLDLLVHLDTMLFHPKGHLYLQPIFGYLEGQIILMNRKVGTGSKYLIDDRVRK